MPGLPERRRSRICCKVLRLPARPRVTAQAAASSLGIELVFGPIGDTHAEIESAFEAFARTSNGGLILPPDTTSNIHRDLLIALAARHRLPAVYSDRLFVEAGG